MINTVGQLDTVGVVFSRDSRPDKTHGAGLGEQGQYLRALLDWVGRSWQIMAR